MRRARLGGRGFRPSAQLAYAPRSKAELAKLTDEELRELAPKLGVDPAGPRAILIQRIEEQGVAHVADKTVREAVDPNDPMVDPDAQAIADSTLDSLPDNHPDKDSTIAPEVLRAPAQVDEAPTPDHRAPEAHGSAPDASTGPEGETVEEEDEDEDDEEGKKLTGEALDERAEELGIDTSTGGSLADGSMSADEKREAVAEAEAEEE